jgi:hypothetical protein
MDSSLSHQRNLFLQIEQGNEEAFAELYKLYVPALAILVRAQKLGLSHSTVKNTLVTSLEHIRNFLKSNGFNISMLSILFLKTL